MNDFLRLLQRNRNYRYTWSGQVVSEIGDHFNNIAVFALAMEHGNAGMVVTGVMLSRAIPAVMVGPFAGILLDRFDRKRIMIASDLIRAVVALGFILAIKWHSTNMLYMLERAADGGFPVLHERPVGDLADALRPRKNCIPRTR